MLAALLLLAAPAIEVEAATGVAIGSPNSTQEGANEIPLMLRAGVAPIDQLTISAAFLGIPGGEPRLKFCSMPCAGNAAFKAVSGFVIARGHTTGPVQVFGDAGVGIGHLIRLSGDQLFENPAHEGRAGPAFWFGGGVRGVVTQGLMLGAEVAWTRWTNVSRPAYDSGIFRYGPTSGLTVDALLLLLNVSWSFAM